MYHHDISNTNVPTESLLYRIAVEKKWKLLIPNKDMIKKEGTTIKENKAGYYSKDIQLYNLEKDPFETTNVAAEHPEVVSRLTKKINDWWQPKTTMGTNN